MSFIKKIRNGGENKSVLLYAGNNWAKLVKRVPERQKVIY